MLWWDCDSFVCHYLGISDFRSIHACMMYLLHTLLSEYQQVPQYANSGRRVKFCRQYDCFNPTPLHPHLGALCFRSFQDGGPCGARDVEKIFMCRFSFFMSAPTPASMNVLGYRSRGWLLIMIVAPFGASCSWGLFSRILCIWTVSGRTCKENVAAVCPKP